MANEEHLAILKQGVEAWNQWRRENPSIVPDLAETDLSSRNLNGANLSKARLIRRLVVDYPLGLPQVAVRPIAARPLPCHVPPGSLPIRREGEGWGAGWVKAGLLGRPLLFQHLYPPIWCSDAPPDTPQSPNKKGRDESSHPQCANR
jgi:hypothetical protein